MVSACKCQDKVLFKKSVLSTYSFCNCRCILTRFTHSSQVVRLYRAYSFVFPAATAAAAAAIILVDPKYYGLFKWIYCIFRCVSNGFSFKTYIFGFTCQN
jgi:hypothetical protein